MHDSMGVGNRVTIAWVRLIGEAAWRHWAKDKRQLQIEN
jgi:hypothetical protein